ncbi:MAG: bifunctional hydroxymethylpyrimidine kinase/phosphomethylpyrimidine kinase [Thermodesulfobacteriota bacterium]
MRDEAPPCLLTIAGSDPSGGAGIQADLKTFCSLACYGGAVITALTCQNSLGVSASQPVEPRLVAEQIQAVLSDLPVSHIKIGMSATAAIASAIGQALANFPGEIIFDPVLHASSGQSLHDGAESKPLAALAPLLSRCTVLTPNGHELATLSGCQEVKSLAQAKAAGLKLMAELPQLRAICIKGGHLAESKAEVVDLLIWRQKNGQLDEITESHPRLTTRNSHGTGCTFASAFTALLARGNDYPGAFTKSVAYVAELLAKSQGARLGHGTGPLLHHLHRC